MNELEKYFAIINKIRGGQQRPSRDELEFFLSFTPEIDETKLKKLTEGGQFATTEDARNAIIEAGRMFQSSPEYKQDLLDLSQSKESGKISQKLADGINLVLGGVDIGNSVAQIRESNKLLKTRRPSRPTAPGRDQLLQQALRNAQENTFDTERAIAPVRAEIGDQYLNDIQGAKTASTGQAGAYGAYRQLAANRRNRAALQLAPIQDEIRRGQQARYDNLLGMRMDETNSMFRNQASLYPYDLEQYQNEQQAAGHLGATGRSNLRGSLYNAGAQAASTIGNNYAQARYAKLRNQSTAAGMSPEDTEKYIIGADLKLRDYIDPVYRRQTMYEQSYT